MPSPSARRDALRARLLAEAPAWYSPWVHLAFPSLFGAAVVALCVRSLGGVRPVELLVVPLVLVVSNAIEWHVHRGLLHRRTAPLGMLYERHTPQHHRVFVTEDMAMRSWQEFRLVLIPFYGVVAVVALDAPVAALLWLGGLRHAAALFLCTSTAYVIGYEWLHLCYHFPAHTRIGRSRLLARLRHHHAIHHAPELMQRWNFNVTVPLWDWVRGTIHRPGPDDRPALLPARRGILR